jgi:hypothetical protein
LLSKTIKEQCSDGFSGGFYVKNMSITFQSNEIIRVTGTVDMDPNAEGEFGGNLESWVEVNDMKSIWQLTYGPKNNRRYYVESNGKKYKLGSVELC